MDYLSALNVTTIIIASRNIAKKKVSKINTTLLSLDGKFKKTNTTEPGIYMIKSPSLTEYPNRELTQRYLSPHDVYRLERKDNGYIIINTGNDSIVKVPDGEYLFTVKANTYTSAGCEWRPRSSQVSFDTNTDQADIMLVIPAPRDVPEHPGDGFGHTSMVQLKVPTRSPVVARVYYAGELSFVNGNLLKWTNKSGHFRPASANSSVLPAAVLRLLPRSLYQDYHCSR